MGDVKSFSERSREFEQAHKSCCQLLEGQLYNIETFVSRWILIALGAIFLFQAAGFTYFYFEIINLRKRVDYRYFLTKETLEDIHKVKIENGQVIKDYKN